MLSTEDVGAKKVNRKQFTDSVLYRIALIDSAVQQ